MIKLYKLSFLFVFVAWIGSSCVPNEKIIYMQNQGADSQPLVSSSEEFPYQNEEYQLQNFDIVEISIKTTNDQLNAIFNVITGEGVANTMTTQNGGDVFFMNGYTLDDEGKVELPLIGEMELKGHTTKSAKKIIEEKVSKYVNEGEYFVRVRLGGIRFSALGEFNQPGKQTVLQNRVSIFEAIAAAGDMTVLAKRDEITLLRQYPDGSKIHKINLIDQNLLSSEFYFIKPNDVLYAEPLKIREVGAGTNFIQTLSLVTTTVTTIALIITLVQNAK